MPRSKKAHQPVTQEAATAKPKLTKKAAVQAGSEVTVPAEDSAGRLTSVADQLAARPATEISMEEVPNEVSAPVGHRPWSWYWNVAAALVIIAVLAVAGFELVYAGRVFPGVTADGVLLGGLRQGAVGPKLQSATAEYSAGTIPVTYGKTVLHIPVSQLGVTYDISTVANLAYHYGREGNLWQRLHEQLRALAGRATNFADYHYDDLKLVPFLSQVGDDVTTPVVGPSFTVVDDQPQAVVGQSGTRLDTGRLVQALADRLSRTASDPIQAPVYSLAATNNPDSLKGAAALAAQYLSGPVTINYATNQKVLDTATIASWLVISQPGITSQIQLPDLYSFYPTPTPVALTLDAAKVTAYIDSFTTSVNHPAVNAVLSMNNGQLTVVTPSQDGVALDQAEAHTDIMAALSRPIGQRSVTLSTKVTQADVRADNLDQLGIKEQISEGVTYFPGSPATRLINVRTGAQRFNDVLLKPGEVFSFGALLGDVGPAQGYVPELVILGDHEEKQYGGGLCQVSSTAFRAALAAGLPILERVNHAFAISYYTAPYGVPGVDATIYYPDVDFKFRNDTPGYILIQTDMQGTTLKFDFYGTKVKSGVIRGPYFVSGSNDATQPSQTVFYRDVLDLTGKVVKTDTFNTFYKPSTDFPITKQFN